MRQKYSISLTLYMAGYTQIGDETGILEGQTRPQRQGDFEYSFNTYHEKYLDMEGIWTPNHLQTGHKLHS